jgi:ribosome-associated translation inhibitor RaiA
VKRKLSFINCRDEMRLRRLLEQLIRRLERRFPATRPDSVWLRATTEKNPVHERYRVTVLMNVPDRTIVAKEEGHDAVETIREAMNEVERQLIRHQEFIRSEPLWRRPARRAAIEQEKLKAAAAYSGAPEAKRRGAT